jgi:hypothetical protein
MQTIIQEYFRALESGDVAALTNLFSMDGIIHSPLYGERPARDFYRELMTDTMASTISLLNIFINPENANIYAAHFKYDWTLKDGTKTNFECIDIFQFDQQKKIRELTIIYDTHELRSIFNNRH